MTAMEWRVRVGDDEVSVLYEAADGDPRATFVCAHGAGGSMRDRSMTATAAAMRAAGIAVVRFNFVYREKRSSRPDRMPALTACVAAVAERARQETAAGPLVLGGRSMGGRAASMLVADGYPCDGLLLLAYPLHPAGDTGRLRDAHLPAIAPPVLCVNGTRDALCRRDLMDGVLATVGAGWTMHWVEGADHSFHVLKSSGRTDAQVMDEIRNAARDWVTGVAGP
ncbi:MAG: alpha/beta family hydrolase [Gemmatimonadaceae bacterium]